MSETAAIPDRGWNWSSTPLSVRRGQPSILALAETFFAMIGFVWILSSTNIASIAIIINAPLLLVSTERLTNAAVRQILGATWWFENRGIKSLAEIMDPLAIGLSVLVLFCGFSLWMITLLVAIIMARILRGIIEVARYPVRCIRQISFNWFRVVLCADMVTSMSIMAGDFDANTRFGSNHNKSLESMPVWTQQLVRIVIMSVAGVLAAAYRLSFKGCAFMYIPLLYIIHSTTSGHVFASLRDLRELLIHRIALFFGTISIAVLLFRMLMTDAWNSTGDWLTANAPVINQFVQPDTLPKWQVASAVNGLIGIVLFLIADVVSRWASHSTEVSLNFKPWSMVFRSVWFLRAVLSVYSIGCVLYIAASMLKDFPWPELANQWLPWSLA